MGDDYRDPLAAAHARIAVLESENQELRRATTSSTAEPPAGTGEAEAQRLDQELLRLDLAWQRRWGKDVGFDPKRLDRKLDVFRYVTVGAALLLAVGPAVSGVLPWFITICCALLLLLAAWMWTLSERQLTREWPEHQAKRKGLAEAAARARSGGDQPEVALRVHVPGAEAARVEDDDAQLVSPARKSRR
jgi:hypothetical protein